MKQTFKKALFGSALAMAMAVAAFARDPQAPSGGSTPQSNAPQTQNPQAEQPVQSPSEPQPAAAGAPEQPPASPENPPTTPSRAKPADTKQPSGSAKSRRPVKAAAHKRKPKRQGTLTKSATDSCASGSPGRIVVRNGGTRDGTVRLSAGGSQEQELHNRENTAQLLATTDQNLKNLAGRQLTPSERSTVGQIQLYMRQSKSATDAGDLARAHTLAFKAHLLSDNLMKR